MRIGAPEFPTLRVTDLCSVASTSGLGTDVFYRTTQTPLPDGSAPEAQPGVITKSAYRSSPARANGRTVEIIHAFTGDVLLTNTVEGLAPGASPVYTYNVRCEGDTTRTLSLSASETRLITGIATGAVCRVEQLSGSPRYRDNSGDPTDGVVVVRHGDAACWDLRNATADCRSVVNVINQYSSQDTEIDRRSQTDDDQTTTTVEQNNQQVKPATTAAPAVAAEPLSEAGVAFTG